jgi:hypothetical protein
MNLYDLVNEELKRMYEEKSVLFNILIQISENKKFGDVSGHNHRDFSARFRAIESEIKDIRSKMLTQFESHDQKIQEKIAELALTGNTNE